MEHDSNGYMRQGASVISIDENQKSSYRQRRNSLMKEKRKMDNATQRINDLERRLAVLEKRMEKFIAGE